MSEEAKKYIHVYDNNNLIGIAYMSDSEMKEYYRRNKNELNSTD